MLEYVVDAHTIDEVLNNLSENIFFVDLLMTGLIESEPITMYLPNSSNNPQEAPEFIGETHCYELRFLFTVVPYFFVLSMLLNIALDYFSSLPFYPRPAP